MAYPEQIVIYCRDEKDRELVEFALRRYRGELEQMFRRRQSDDIAEEAKRCGHMILEVKQAGT